MAHRRAGWWARFKTGWRAAAGGWEAPTLIRLGDHDVLTVHVPGAITREAAESIRTHFRGLFPLHSILVVSDGISLGVITRSQAEHAAAKLQYATLPAAAQRRALTVEW